MIQSAKKLDAINEYGSILALSYVAAQRTFYGYNDMADAKALLESIARSFGYIYGREHQCSYQHYFSVTDHDHCRFRCEGYGSSCLTSPTVCLRWVMLLLTECADYCIVMFSDLTRKVTMQNLYPRRRFLQRRYELACHGNLRKGTG